MNTLNNPFFVLEKAWQAGQDHREKGIYNKTDLSDKMHNADSGDSVQSHFGSENQGFHAHTARQHINLSSICISTIFQIEDDHLPGPLLKIYAHCLQKGRVDPQDKQNAATLRLCHYLFKKWHDTRSRLNFIRDTMKIILAFARRFSDNVVHVDRAIDGCPVSKYRVWTTLLHQLKKEMGGMSLGDYLSRHEGGLTGNDFSGLTFNLFDRADVMASSENAGYFSGLMLWPGLSYARQVTLHLVSNIYKLNRQSSSHALFEECVPSWAEEKRRNHPHNDLAYNEDRQLRNDILTSLLNGHVQSASGSDNNSRGGYDDDVSPKRQKSRHETPHQRQMTRDALAADQALLPLATTPFFSADKSPVLSPPSTSGADEEDDLTSIDTRSFRRAMSAPRYIVPETHPGREPGAEDVGGNFLLGREKNASVVFFDARSPTEILDNESKLNTLFTGMPQALANPERDEKALSGACVKAAALFESPVMPETTPSTRITFMIDKEKDDTDDNDVDIGTNVVTAGELPVPDDFDAPQNVPTGQAPFDEEGLLLYDEENDNDDVDDEDDGL